MNGIDCFSKIDFEETQFSLELISRNLKLSKQAIYLILATVIFLILVRSAIFHIK